MTSIRRRLPFALAATCLILTAAAGAGPADNQFTAVSTPSFVQPAPVSRTYTITLTNDPSPSGEADRATISPPSGFHVAASGMTANVTGCGSTQPWSVQVLADGKIGLKRNGGSSNNLCAGGSLVVVFSATADTPGTYEWGVELRQGDDPAEPAFILRQAQLVVHVDGTPPETSINSGPPAVTSSTSASFAFSSEAGATFECSLDGGAFSACESPKSYTGLSAGTRTFEVRARDQAGNQDPTPATHSWTIDLTPPTTTIDSGPPSLTNSANASLAFSSEAGATFECSLDGGAFSACTSPKNYSGLPEGPRTFQVRAIDQAGNADPTPATHDWTIDLTPPQTTIDTGPPSLTNSTSASFTFSSETGATFECRLDGGAFSACESPKNYAGLSAGARTFRVRAIDAAGNPDPSPAIQSWTIDVTPPETTISKRPDNPTNSTSATFEFSSSEAGSFQCSLDGADFTACTSPQSYSGLPGGVRSFAVRATDQAGNVDATPATHSWTIDLNGPPTSISGGPPSATNSKSASFTFSSEAGATFECSLDGALFTPCTSPKDYGELSDGGHTFAVRAVDQARNTGPASSRNWTIDTRAPAAAISSGPAALSNRRSAAFAFSADEGSSFVCALDGAAFQPCTSPVSYDGLSDGAHSFAVQAIDAVGNVGSAPAYAWAIDATAPETTLGSVPRSGTATSATFRFSASEPVSFECRLDGGSFAACTSPKSYVRLSKARHTFTVRAIDAAGNIDPTPATHSWAIKAAQRAVKKTSALFAPEAGARIRRPPRLAWRPAARASYYNVQLYRGSVKVLSAWPTRPRLQLRARWTYLGRQRRLSPGRYRWYVWPAFRNNRYGRLLGQSTFIVRRG